MAGKLGVLSPVTQSQPGTAVNPLVPQPRLLPIVTSFKTSGFAYGVGLRKPLFFALSLRALIMFTSEAKVGQEAEVPNASEDWPLTATM